MRHVSRGPSPWRSLLRSPLIRVDWLACARDLDASIADVPLPPEITIRPAAAEDFARMAEAMARPEFRGDVLTIDDIERLSARQHLRDRRIRR